MSLTSPFVPFCLSPHSFVYLSIFIFLWKINLTLYSSGLAYCDINVFLKEFRVSVNVVRIGNFSICIYNTFPYWIWSEISLNLLCEGLSHTSEKSHIPLSGLSLVPEVWQPPTRRMFDTGGWLVWRQLSAALLLEKTVLRNMLRPCHPPPLEPRGNGQHFCRERDGIDLEGDIIRAYILTLWFWTTCFLSNWSPRRPLGIACVFVLF